MNKQEAQAVEQLRRENSDLLSAKYGTDYNVLRWAQGYGFDLEEASAQLRRHLKFRKFYDLDNADQIPEHEILKKYFPIGLVGECSHEYGIRDRLKSATVEKDKGMEGITFFLLGETGQDNTLLVIECAGRIDLVGILKSVQLSDFLIQRARLQEKMLDAMNELEAETGKQV
ncbi:hypothetical protein ANCDUO_18476 [Ancylostoma duodenale]|uniref:Uncharacterized protein n=1 Tax=Ancylostoma duodenale TaxID=51022 RepID=A0A0C2C574_9BILA|nr:hypothetical protein ANCDUO_18476 [Ancylostoma duodenale]